VFTSTLLGYQVVRYLGDLLLRRRLPLDLLLVVLSADAIRADLDTGRGLRLEKGVASASGTPIEGIVKWSVTRAPNSGGPRLLCSLGKKGQ
jgi:hypothetical protein